MNKKEIASRYFNGMGGKHLSEFETNTPEGNHIKGYICKKHNYFLGSLYITEVNGEETGQFVQGFPKIHYPEPNNDYYTYDLDSMNGIGFYEKLDGTNIVFYPLKNHLGGVIEVVPKTRNLPVADSSFISILKTVDLEPVNYHIKNGASSIMVELYGIRNQHEIYYYDTYIKITLLGIYFDDIGCGTSNYLNEDELNTYYGFNRPRCFFQVFKQNNKYRLSANPTIFTLIEYHRKKTGYSHLSYTFDTFFECCDYIKNFLQYINEEYYKKHGYVYTEGVVCFGYNEHGHDFYLKIKPTEIEEKHRQNNRVSSKYIRKEIYKYFDEYGSQIKELYEEDDKHYYNYVIDNLKEHCTDEQINHPKTKKKIEKLFFEKWNAVSIPESLQKICEQIVTDNPGRETSELMSIFAQEHPEKKKLAKDVFKHMDAINHRLNGGK